MSSDKAQNSFSNPKSDMKNSTNLLIYRFYREALGFEQKFIALRVITENCSQVKL